MTGIEWNESVSDKWTYILFLMEFLEGNKSLIIRTKVMF